MTKQWILAIAAAAAIACGSADRRTFNDRIDEREAGATEQASLYADFEAELVDELEATYGAEAEGGCPPLNVLPAVTNGEEREAEAAALVSAWRERLPAEHCLCLQSTARRVRAAIEEINLDQFDAERERLNEMSNEELARFVAFRGFPAADEFKTETAEERIATWKTRRHDDWRVHPEWRGDVDAWEVDETRHGWEEIDDYHIPATGHIRETERHLLSRIEWRYDGRGCDRF